MTTSIAIIQFPGSNTERETLMACCRVGLNPVEFLWNESAEKLTDFDGYMIVGGFAYEDRSRAGVIAALDPIMNQIKIEADKGKPILGICNGAQILVEAGMVPGNTGFNTLVGLSQNKRVKNGQVVGTGYYNIWCNIKSNAKNNSAFIDKDCGDFLSVPLAHAEGRFVMNDDLKELVEKENLAAYHYCNEGGEVINNFPINPNGSTNNIAALGNVAGNVLAMMPHPERTTKGDPIFKALNQFLNTEASFSYKSLKYTSQKITLSPFKKKKQATELLISMIIADNEAISVGQCIKKLGVKGVVIKKYLHLEIEHGGALDIENICATDVLFNPSKEFVVGDIEKGVGSRFLVREKENIEGRKMKETLQKRFGFTNVTNVLKGVVWEICSQKKQIKKDVDLILNSHILCNPISQECHEY